MITSNDISILITTTGKDLERLQSVYNHIRTQYAENEIVIVYDGIDYCCLDQSDENLIQVSSAKRVYVSGGYNLALQHSTKPAFVFLHDDTYTAPEFLENLTKHITDNCFVNFCQVEPPVFGEADSIYKPIRDFGLRDTPFQKQQFEQFYWERKNKLPHNEQPSPYGGFFMAGMKESIMSVGGFDETFQPFFYEDSDLMVRLHMAGFKFILALDSLVYHVGSLTSREVNGGMDAQKVTHDIFVKKWKTTFELYKTYSIDNGIPYTAPKVSIQYTKCSPQLQHLIKLLSTEDASTIVYVDGSTMQNTDVDYLLQLPYIITTDLEEGLYMVGNLQIKV